MLLDRIIKWFIPKEDHFFDLFERGTDCVLRASSLLAKCCRDDIKYDERAKIVEQMRQIEFEADKVIYEVYEALNRTFVTPLDRSDIYNLSTDLEDITDDLFNNALQIVLHDVEKLPQGAQRMSELIVASTQEIEKAVSLLRHMKKFQEIRNHCKEISRIISEGGQVFSTQMAELFRHEKDAISLIKQKEFLEGLQRTLRTCDDMANALETIVIKNA